VITAAFETKQNKLPYLKVARNKIELLKRLLRITSELHIITLKKHTAIQAGLQEISRMTNGWIRYIEKP